MAKGYGGFLGPILSSIAHVAARQLLIGMGRKEPHRGGARIKTARRLTQGKDKYGHKKE